MDTPGIRLFYYMVLSGTYYLHYIFYKGLTMAVKLDEKAYRELRQALRDYKTKGRVEAMLTKLQHSAYRQGYEDAYQDASKKIYEVVNATNESSNTGHDLDGEQLQSDSGEYGASTGTDADNFDSSKGSAQSESEAPAH